MVFRTFLFGFLVAGISGISFAQSPGFGANGPLPGSTSAFPGSMGQIGQSSLIPNRSLNSITGSVYTQDNRPVNNARIELRDSNTGAVLGSSFTGVNGSFEFGQLPQGSYQLVAFSGTSTTEERIQVNSMGTTVDLRLPVTRNPNDGLGNQTVSVAHYRIPQAAREELRKAQEAADKNKPEEALKHIDKALELSPAYADALTLRAVYKMDKQDLHGAVEDLQKAIQSDGNCALAYTVLGSALNMESKFDEALRALEHAESVAPDTWQVQFELGRSYAGKNDYQMSLKALERAEKLSPSDYPLIHLIRAHDLIALGRNADAAAELQTFVEKNPASPHAEQAKQMLTEAQAAKAEPRN